MKPAVSATRLWLTPALLVAANLLALALHYGVLADWAATRAEIFDRSSTTLNELREERRGLESWVARLETARSGMESFYADRLGSEEKRLTEVLAEIKDLARTAGLEPSAVGYDTEALEENGVVRRTISFNVTGRYMDLRRLINLLELSDSFLTLRQVTLNEGVAGSELRINLALEALFAERGPLVVAPEAPRGRRGR